MSTTDCFRSLLVTLLLLQTLCLTEQQTKPQISEGQIIAGYDWISGKANKSRVSPQFSFVSPSNEIYIVEPFHHMVKKINNSGHIQIVAGSGDIGFEGDGHLATKAKLNRPQSVFVNSVNEVFIADSGNHRIRKVDPTSGKIETVFFQPSNVIQPIGVSYSSLFGLVFSERSTVRGWKDGKLSLLAGTGEDGYNGDGNGPDCQLNRPSHLHVEENGEILISDMMNNRVRRLHANMSLSTIAGGGLSPPNNVIPTNSSLFFPHQATSNKGKIFISDSYSLLKIENNRITRILPWKGDNVMYLGISAYNNSVVYCDYLNGYLKQYDTVKGGQPSILAGFSFKDVQIDGRLAIEVPLGNTRGLSLSKSKEIIFSDDTNLVYKISNDGIISKIGNSNSTYSTMDSVSNIVVSPEEDVYFSESSRIRKFNKKGIIEPVVDQLYPSGANNVSNKALSTILKDANGLYLDSSSNILFIADTNNNQIRKVVNGTVFSIPNLNKPSSISVSKLNGDIYFTDSSSVKKISSSNGQIDLVAGQSTPGYNGDGSSSAVKFDHPCAMYIHQTPDNQEVIYVSDCGNSLIRRIFKDGRVETLFKAQSNSLLVDGDGIYTTEKQFIVKRTFTCENAQTSSDGITCSCKSGFILTSQNHCIPSTENSLPNNGTVESCANMKNMSTTMLLLFSSALLLIHMTLFH